MKIAQTFLFLLLQTLLILSFSSSPIPEPKQALPTNFWWGNHNSTNFLTLQRNQLIPQVCGSCWAFAVTSSISDRIKILRKAAWPDIIISPQVLLSCDTVNRGCFGGNPPLAYKWIMENNITDQTCSPYQSLGHSNGLGCSAALKCGKCSLTSCNPLRNGKIYTIKQHGTITLQTGGEAAMMNEIYTRGPISCEIAVTDQFMNYTGGIFNDTTGKKGYEHDISVTGWGQENGVKFWHIRNSWGSYWGENGDLRLIKGVNNLGIQANCSWGVPLDTWTEDIRNRTDPNPTKNEKIHHILLQNRTQHILKPEDETNIPYQSQSSIPKSDLPLSFDWRNHNSKNYLTDTRTSQSPAACASSWALAATSALADRIKIARNGAWPELLLSAQSLINCQNGGNCSGGYSLDAYRSINEMKGIPEETCQNYMSRDSNSTCSDIQKCQVCSSKGCSAAKKYSVWKVTSYGALSSNIQQLKQQIITRGPITCGIQVTQRFANNYTSGIYAQPLLNPVTNHHVSLVGWGISNDIQYWIGRNSWGTTWGQSGFFRMQMRRNNLGIEKMCSWGAVDKDPIEIVIENTKKSNEEELQMEIL